MRFAVCLQAKDPIMTSNDNVLAGLKCQRCGSLEPLQIETRCISVVWDDGVDDTREFEWDSNSPCVCVECGYTGTVLDFHCTESAGAERINS